MAEEGSGGVPATYRGRSFKLLTSTAGTGSAGTPRRTMGSLGAVGEAPQMPGLPSVSQVESLGQLLIPTINRLQDLFNQVTLDYKLELPQVAVIGSQSSGKSSVLEALVGRDFLPRGPEICTRRPLVLQLVKQGTSSGSGAPAGSGSNSQEWGEFLHAPGKRFFDFDRIRQEIMAETERVTGANKGISDKAIRLKICSPHVLTMTLVDLPGIAKVPVGDQPSDIETRIRNMVLEYIRHPTCVILAVSAANHDLVNSDALELARSADPDGHRTIGVLTKLDIMDRGTNAVKVLQNQVVPLRLGYIGVINRSQQDIITRRNIRDARAAEAAFFEAHPEYQEVAAQCGVMKLASSLNVILVEHIRLMLPQLRSAIDEALEKRLAELRLYGDPLVGSASTSRWVQTCPPKGLLFWKQIGGLLDHRTVSADSGALLLRLLDSYAVRFSEMLDGRSEHLPTSELAGGARIRHIFQDIFVRGLSDLNPSSELTDEDVRTAIKNSGGVKGSLLIPDAPFELLVRRALTRLLPLALQCKEFVHAELLKIAGQCSPPDVDRFPTLQRQLKAAVEDYIHEGAQPTERMIRDFAACEHAYINTDHPSFIGGNRAVALVLQRRHGGAESDGADEECLEAGGQERMGSEQPHQRARHLQEQRRPKSTGNLQDPPPSTGPLGSGGRPQRPPLAETAAANQREPRPGLKGVELELYSPEELLRGPHQRGQRQHPAAQPTAPQQRQQHRPPDMVPPETGPSGGAGWFSLPWFGSHHGPSENGRISSPGGSSSDGDSGNRPAALYPPSILRVPGSVSEQEEVQVEVTRLLVDSYFDIVRKNMQDNVPKAVMHFLVNHVQRGLQQHLIKTLYREELFSEMMKEREDIATKRLACHNAVKALREASAALEMLPVELLQRLQGPQPSSQEAPDGAGQPQTAPRQGLLQGQTLQSAAPAQPARSPGQPRLGVAAGTHAAQLAMAAASNDNLAMRRAESIANPFGYN